MKKGYTLAIDTSKIFQAFGGSNPLPLLPNNNEEENAELMQRAYDQAIDILEQSIEPFELLMLETHETDLGEFMYVTGGFLTTHIEGNDKLNYIVDGTMNAHHQKKLTVLVNDKHDMITQKRQEVYGAALQYVRDAKLKKPGLKKGVTLFI